MNGRAAANLAVWALARPHDPGAKSAAFDACLLIELANLTGPHTWGLALEAALERMSAEQ